MRSLRYELTEAQWRRIEPLLPERHGTVGRPVEDNRRFVNGVLWVISLGNALGGPAGTLWQVQERP